MASKTLVFTIQAADGDALKAFGRISAAAKKDMKAVEAALDDGRTAGKRMADALSKMAYDLDTDFLLADDAARKLADALGPEMAASLGANGIEGLVRDLNRAGLEMSEIGADADVLAASIKELDDVQLNRVRTEIGAIDDGIRKVSTSTDQSRGVMANFAGNAASSLPGVEGAFGALNVAVGQFAEYATEGGISLKGLLKTAAPIAVATIGIALVASHLKNIAETKAFNRDRVDDFTDALRDGGSAAASLEEQIWDVGKIEFRFGSMDKAKDLIPVLAQLGLKLDDYLGLIEKSPAELDKWATAQFGATKAALEEAKYREFATLGAKAFTAVQQAQLTVLNVVAQEYKNTAAASADYASEVEVLGLSTKQVSQYLEDQAARIEAVKDAAYVAKPVVSHLGVAIDGVAEAAMGSTPEIEALILKYQLAGIAALDMAVDTIEAADSIRAQFDKGFAVDRAIKSSQEALANLEKVVGSSKSSVLDMKIAIGDTATVLYDGAAAVGELAAAHDENATAEERAITKNQAMRDELAKQRDALAPGSPLRVALQQYVAALDAIPGTIVTRFSSVFDSITRPSKSGGGSAYGADGAIVTRPTMALIGEAGPEALVPLNRMPGAYPLSTGAAGGTVIVNLTVQGSVTSERDLIGVVRDGLLRDARAIGAVWARV